MSNDAIDLALARHVRQIGLVSQEQINSALQLQSTSIKRGKYISFSEVLVQMGLLTAPQRETLEKKIRDQQSGVTQLGPYKLVKKIGEGGMGAVYLAQDAAGKNVAVKVLPRHLGTNAEFVKRFKREADAATMLKHPNIIGAFAAGEDLGYHYYVMEYCDGQPVDVLLAARKVFPIDEALTLALQVAGGLKYAHDLGIIHRDIKPSNIMLARDGEAKVLDLGLSKNLDDAGMSFKTVTGAVLGTPHYISPEQAQGEKKVDGRSDIYSLGATLYHLLTGKTPFDGQTALEILSKHVNTTLPNPQDLREEIPDPVVQVLERMMAKDPVDRHRDCGELISDLVEVSQGRTPKSKMIAASLTTIAPPVRRAALRKRPHTLRRAPEGVNPKTLGMIGGGVAAAVIAVLVIVMMPGRAEPPRDPSPPPAPPPRIVKETDPAKSGFDPAIWEKSIAELPPEARVKAVHARLKTLNPGYDSSESEHYLAHGRVDRLRIGSRALKDLTPLRALTGLRELELPSSEVTDLSPLRDSKLSLLVLDGSKVSDLRPIHDLKELSILSLASAPVRDLSPLEGMDLSRLTIKGCPVTDLSPLKRVKLRELNCDFEAKRDTDVLKSMPALEQINGVPVEEFWRRLRAAEPEPVAAPLPAPGPQDPLSAALAKLKQANPDWGGRETHLTENGEVLELIIVSLGITDLSPLAPLKTLRKLDVSGYWSLSERKEYRSGLQDIGPLRGLKLRSFLAHHTDVTDLGPLEGMPLEMVDITGCGVSSLAPLKGAPLRQLFASFNSIRDLSPLAGMPIWDLRLTKEEVADFSPLQRLPGLRILLADLDPVRHRALVASLK
ncbi:MAG TPA: protein kinase, partial [Planctomycetota bacterium]|nr:protein kinase [Planctomycetota bacterium]